MLSSFVELTVSFTANAPDTLSICICNLGSIPGGSSYLNPWSIGLTDNALPILSDTGNISAPLPPDDVTVTVGNDR